MVKMIVLVAVLLLVAIWGARWLEPRLAFFPYRGEDVTPAAFGLAFTSYTIDTADGERLRLWHLPHPAPRAQVVYFHGNGGNLSLWTEVLAGLRQQDFDVVAVDYRGYGLSTGRPTEPGLYRDVEATIAFTHARLRVAGAPLLYWGRSLGTAMAAHAARTHPPAGVVLEAGFPDARSVLRSNPVLLALSVLATYRFPTAALMSSVRVPVLVIHGDQDRVISPALGQRLYEALAPPKQMLSIRGGDHNDPRPADPGAYWSGVHAFAASLANGGGPP